MRSLSDIYTTCNFYMIEPKTYEEAIHEEVWNKIMQKEINVIEKNKAWELVEKPNDKKVIGMK